MKRYINDQEENVREMIETLMRRYMNGQLEVRIDLNSSAVNSTGANSTVAGAPLVRRSSALIKRSYSNRTDMTVNGTHAPVSFAGNPNIRTAKSLSELMRAKTASWPIMGGLPDRRYSDDEA